MTDKNCLIRKLTLARPMIEAARRVLAAFPFAITGMMLAVLLFGVAQSTAQQLTNGTLSVTVNRQDGSYQFGPTGSQPALQSSIRRTGRSHVAAFQRAILRIRFPSRHSATRLAPVDS